MIADLPVPAAPKPLYGEVEEWTVERAAGWTRAYIDRVRTLPRHLTDEETKPIVRAVVPLRGGPLAIELAFLERTLQRLREELPDAFAAPARGEPELAALRQELLTMQLLRARESMFAFLDLVTLQLRPIALPTESRT